ncbi:DUF819 family protein [Maribacter sp. 2210JD10-5]|uniref:DUF819 family protein n=1 Tax=Maribacter sp. 2210JD10-5 TaxID=3386272 RepID=UPI0039BCD50B
MMVPWLIVLVTVSLVYYLDRWENKHIKSVFDWVPAILLAYLIPAFLSYLFSEDFSQAAIHDFSKDYFIPLAIVSVMASLSLGQLKAIGYRPILVFMAGSVFIAVFPVVFVSVFSETNFVSNTLILKEFWKGVPPIVGSWIGGSTSQLVLKEIVECPEAIFLSVLVMDNILVNVWTILMFQGIKKSNTLNKWFNISDKELPEEIRQEKQKAIPIWVTIIVLTGLVFGINAILKSFVFKVVALSVLGLFLGNYIPRWNYKFSLKAGAVLILVVMAVLGLKLRFDTLGFDVYFFGFLVLWLFGHFLLMILVAKLLNVNMAWVPIASMANVGGIATAPAVTAAYEKKWMPHAIVLAILSMATGTFWGMLTIYLLKLVVS